MTTEKGIYITDGGFSRVLRHTVIDTMFSERIVKPGVTSPTSLIGTDGQGGILLPNIQHSPV